MPKQIKLGFDKIPAPVTKTFPQLVDGLGNELFDSAGNPLLTEEDATLASFAQAEYATSLHVNNEGAIEAVPVEEQFPSESEVSTTLLGVPRAEEQLSLFSDVSTYGYDRDNWNYYNFVDHGNYPRQWYAKKNPFHGNRQEPVFKEAGNEQALYLRSFPSQYGFSSGPQFVQAPDAQPSDTHLQYMRFIAAGKYFHRIFSEFNQNFADRNFLNDDIQIIDNAFQNIPIHTTSFIPDDSNSFMDGEEGYWDLDYGDDVESSFAQIERWTLFYQELILGVARFPDDPGQPAGNQNYRNFEEYSSMVTYLTDETRPGGSNTIERFGILESKKSFRYQPGRISGFTYGIRLKTDPTSAANYIEWGASNESDSYLFQLRGSEFNIIRRSVIPLPDDLLTRQGLDPDDQRLVTPITLKNDNPVINIGQGNEAQSGTHYETVISRTKMNGDPLNGEGPSGYFLQFEDVTMYKIEFSWYGAIGAKFYAYIPVGNGEARWVLMHTLVIENGLGKPIMKNPELKFSYLVYSSNTRTLTEPVFIYKYGSSYYIDGGDEGTVRLTSETSDAKDFTTRTPIVGMLPKNKIQSSTGEFNQNYKKSYPYVINVNSDQPVRIDVEEINGSPDGVHYHYSPSLHNGVSQYSRTVDFTFDTSRTSITAAGNTVFQESDDNAHIIADGVHGLYLSFDEFDNTVATLKRRTGDFNLLSGGIAPLRSLQIDGTSLTPADGETLFTARLTGYNSVAASTVGIYSSKFKIHFLNPHRFESTRQQAEFAIGVTDDEPFIDGLNDNELRFDPVNSKEFVLNDNLHVESCHNSLRASLKGEVFTEQDSLYGVRMDVDPRVPAPPGGNSGRLACVQGEVTVVSYPIAGSELETTGDFAGSYKITFTSTATPPVTEEVLGRAEVGVDLEGLGIFYVSTIQSETVGGVETRYVYVDGDITAGGTRTVTHVQSKLVTLKDDFQLVSYDSNGELRFGGHGFSTTKVLKFNVHPLYPFVAMQDNAHVNNIIIEEITPKGVSTHTPNWIFHDTSISISTIAGESSQLSPSSFNSEDRLSGVRFDSNTLQPLRPGNVIYSFFVGGDQPAKIDLSNVFNFDRKNLTTGVLNNTGIFFTANQIDQGGSVEMTVTAKEQ